MLFMFFGPAAGPQGLDVVDFGLDDELIERLLQVTLGLTLFIDATQVDFLALRRRPLGPAIGNAMGERRARGFPRKGETGHSL